MSRTESEMWPELERTYKQYKETRAKVFSKSGRDDTHTEDHNKVSAIYVSSVIGPRQARGPSSGGTRGPIKLSKQERKRIINRKRRVFVAEES